MRGRGCVRRWCGTSSLSYTLTPTLTPTLAPAPAPTLTLTQVPPEAAEPILSVADLMAKTEAAYAPA